MKPITICVCLYGNYPELARRCLGSIINNCDKKLYELRVGLNECCDETIKYVLQLDIDKIYMSKTNLYKCAMMRLMMKDINTEWMWWFDDDSHIIEPRAIEDRLKLINSRKNDKTILFGHVFYFSHDYEFGGAELIHWMKKQKWYNGKRLPCGVTKYDPNYKENKWFFPTGGNWLIQSKWMIENDWPPPMEFADDVVMAEVIRQTGYEFEDCGSCGVKINDHPRRGVRHPTKFI